MKEFVFYNPTKVVFGEGKTAQIGKYVKGQKCLFLYGSRSIKENGIYDQVVASLKASGVAFVEKSGVQPNPVLSFVHDAIAMARKEQVDCILAVGGAA